MTMLMSLRLYLRLWMPTFWPYDTGCGERRVKKTWSPLSFVIRFLRERMTRFRLLEKGYLSWKVAAVVSLSGDIKGSNFRNSLVRRLNFHDSALCVCVLNAYSRIQTFGCVFLCVVVQRYFSCCGVVCSYLSLCLFGSTDFVGQLLEVQQILSPFML